MDRLLDLQQKIHDQFQGSAAGLSHFFLDQHADAYAAYYTSMYLLQDTAEAIFVHMGKGFSSHPMAAYIEFWGVMQATQIQQDAIVELHGAVVGPSPKIRFGTAWSALRDFRNLVAGHPAKRAQGRPAPQRAFMGRCFGSYDRLTYEVWDAHAAAQPNPTDGPLRGTSHPTVNLRQMINDYEAEAAVVLQNILGCLCTRWP